MTAYWSFKKDYQNNKKRYLHQFKKVLTSGKLIFGPELIKLERKVAKFIRCKYAVGVNSGTDAILISLMSLNLKKNDEIITTANTAIPTVSAIVSSGARPVFVDINEENFLIDTNKIEKNISKKTKAIIVVHLYGQSPNMDKIISLAKKYKIEIIEDCAQSFGALHKNKKLGSFGSLSAFSFYPTKILGAFGDGGMVLTNDKKLYLKLKKLRFYGIKKDYKSEIHGINSRLDELQAAILNIKLDKIKGKIQLRRKIAAKYSKEIKNTNIILPKETIGNKHVYYNFVIRTTKRKKLINHLKKNRIQTKIIYPHLINKMKPYAKYLKKKLVISDKISKQILSIPMYPELTNSSQIKVIKALNSFKG